MTDIERHVARARGVQEQVRYFYARKQKVKIYHGTTNSTRAQKFEKDRCIDVSGLDRVVEINMAEKYAVVEPNVPMDALVDAALRYGLVPPVVPEFPGITVGGAVQGGAAESSSFTHGLFHDTCLEYEIVLGNGMIITASPTKNKDLFFGTACSYGSLGIITLVKLRLIPAKEFVRLTYHVVKNHEEAVSLVQSKSREALQFLDGILFSKNLGVVMTGNFSDKDDLPVSTFSKAFDEWFYVHAENISSKHSHYEEIIPIRDYLFRYDRGAFWMGRCGFTLLSIPFFRLTRFLTHWMFKTRTIFRLLHATNISQRYFVQDISLPEHNALNFLEFVDEKVKVYPLWLCPLRPGKNDALSPSHIDTGMVINVGVWGEVAMEYSDFVALNRDAEKKVAELNGRKVLYAHSYYMPEEFWDIYDKAWYKSLRRTYYADDVFPDVYEKTVVSEKYTSSIPVGIWNALRSHKLPIS